MFEKLTAQYRSLRSDTQFAEILTGSFFTFCSRILGTGLGFMISILIARFYGAEMLGIMAIVQVFILMSSTFALLGTNISILKLIPEHLAKASFTSAFLVYRKTLALIVITSISLGVISWSVTDILAGQSVVVERYSFYIGIAAFFIISKAIMDLSGEAIRAIRMIRLYAVILILPQVTFFGVLLILIWLSQQQNDPFWAQLAAWTITSLAGIFILERAFYTRKQSRDEILPAPLQNIIALSLPMLMTASMHLIIAQVGIMVLGMYCTPDDVGYYSAAVKLATLTLFVLQAINSMAAPKFSELFHTKRMDELFRVAKRSAKLIFWLTSPILLGLIFFGNFFLSLYGEDFSVAYPSMMILVAGQFINSISGSTGYFMNMTGHQKVFRNIIVIATVINIALCFMLIPRFELIGAAIASFASLSFWNITTLFFIHRKFGRSIGYLPLTRIFHEK